MCVPNSHLFSVLIQADAFISPGSMLDVFGEVLPEVLGNGLLPALDRLRTNDPKPAPLSYASSLPTSQGGPQRTHPVVQGFVKHFLSVENVPTLDQLLRT